MFHDQQALAELYQRLVQHGITRFQCRDVLRFLGRRSGLRGGRQRVRHDDARRRPAFTDAQVMNRGFRYLVSETYKAGSRRLQLSIRGIAARRMHGGWSICCGASSRRPRTTPNGELVDDNGIVYAVIMLRTQISLTPEEMRAARAEAKRLGISLAELLRRSLRTLLPVEQGKPWMRYAGMIESGDATSSQRIDDVIYGQKD